VEKQKNEASVNRATTCLRTWRVLAACGPLRQREAVLENGGECALDVTSGMMAVTAFVTAPTEVPMELTSIEQTTEKTLSQCSCEDVDINEAWHGR